MLFTMMISLSSCTISVNLVHTEGRASDVVDETDTVSPEIDTNLTVPVSAI